MAFKEPRMEVGGGSSEDDSELFLNVKIEFVSREDASEALLKILEENPQLTAEQLYTQLYMDRGAGNVDDALRIPMAEIVAEICGYNLETLGVKVTGNEEEEKGAAQRLADRERTLGEAALVNVS